MRAPRVAIATPRLFRWLEPHFRLHNVRGLRHVFDSTGAGGFLYLAAILTREAAGYIASGLFIPNSSFRSFYLELGGKQCPGLIVDAPAHH